MKLELILVRKIKYLYFNIKDFIHTGKGEYSEKGKDKLRLQVVKWFMENKKGNS